MGYQKKAILSDGEVVPVDDILEWAGWYEDADRQVALTDFDGGNISTVFMGLNYNFGDGPPLWFETLVFGGEHNGEADHYSTLEEAMIGHERMVALVS